MLVDIQKSLTQYDEVLLVVKTKNLEKASQYGQSWIIARPFSMLEQIWIKLTRIRNIQEKKGVQKITDEPIEDDFLHAINYCIFGLIIVKEKPKDPFKKEVLIQKYEEVIKDVRDLFERKNHDYGEAWRDLCISSMVDFMLMKHLRGKNMHEIESLSDEMISEIFKDIMNYSVFCRIRIDEGTNALL